MKIGLAIACWNRPQYFSQLIMSLEENILEFKNVESHLFLDGNQCAFNGNMTTDQKLIDECAKTWEKSIIPNKYLHKREWNVSIAINQFELMQMMTSVYEKIIFLEDDVIVSPNFLLVMKSVLDQYHNDEQIFSVSPGFKLLCNPKDQETILKNYDAIKMGEGHFWAEATWSYKWKRIVPHLKKYMEIVYQSPYKDRNNQKIRRLFVDGGRGMPATSQDNAKDWAISLSGMKRARMVVNRATGIGDIGIHSTKQKLMHSRDGHNTIPVDPREKSIKKWRIV